MIEWNRAMALAVKEARAGMTRREGGPFGAVIVKRGRVIAAGHNSVLKHGDPTRHAEVNAIQGAARRRRGPFFDGCVVVTTTEPCPMCFSAIHWGRFDAVIYGTTISDVRRLGFNELTLPATLMKRRGKSPVRLRRVDSAACRALLREWSALPGRAVY